MAITLGGVTLNPQMLWPDEKIQKQLSQTIKRTIGGGLKIREQSLNEGRDITLEASTAQGWLTTDQVDSVNALAQVANTQYTLVIGIQSFTVMFRHVDAPAVDFRPLVFRVDAPVEDYFIGTIKLITV